MRFNTFSPAPALSPLTAPARPRQSPRASPAPALNPALLSYKNQNLSPRHCKLGRQSPRHALLTPSSNKRNWRPLSKQAPANSETICQAPENITETKSNTPGRRSRPTPWARFETTRRGARPRSLWEQLQRKPRWAQVILAKVHHAIAYFSKWHLGKKTVPKKTV